MIKKSTQEKFNLVLEKNTFYFHNEIFEEQNEGFITSINQLLLLLKQKIETEGFRKEVFVSHIRENEYGLMSLLTLVGFSKESLLRLITFVRVVNDESLNRLVNRKYWNDNSGFDKEWSEKKIISMVQNNEKFAEGLINLFFEGSTHSTIRRALPLFEYKKLNLNKLKFTLEELIDTIVRYKIKGSYSASKYNNPEALLEEIFKKYKLSPDRGELENISRRMDFILPNRIEPKMIIEVSYVVTTSSGMGDKAKTEISIKKEISSNYPGALFIGFVDGIGWYVRQGDLKRMVSAYDDVFTFNKDELNRFEKLLKKVLNIK